MVKMLIVISFVFATITSFSQHTLDFIIPPCPHVGVSESDAIEGFDVFPNPAGEVLYVQLPERATSSELNIEIFNLLGKTVFQKKYQDAGYLIDISLTDLPKGAYIIRIRKSDEVLHKKIIIE